MPPILESILSLLVRLAPLEPEIAAFVEAIRDVVIGLPSGKVLRVRDVLPDRLPTDAAIDAADAAIAKGSAKP